MRVSMLVRAVRDSLYMRAHAYTGGGVEHQFSIYTRTPHSPHKCADARCMRVAFVQVARTNDRTARTSMLARAHSLFLIIHSKKLES